MLPSDLRARLGLHAGDEVSVSLADDGALRVESRRAAAYALIGLAASTPGLLDDLREQRRREFEAQEADIERFGRTDVSSPAGTVTGR